MPKIYDKELDEKVGKPAEIAVLKYLHSIAEPWWTITSYPDGDTGIDIALVNSLGVWWIDVERRRNWQHGSTFPFSTIHVPERKTPMITAHVADFIYFSVRDDLKVAALIRGDVILSSPMVEIDNCETDEPDSFYDIPTYKIWEYRSLNGFD